MVLPECGVVEYGILIFVDLQGYSRTRWTYRHSRIRFRTATSQSTPLPTPRVDFRLS